MTALALAMLVLLALLFTFFAGSAAHLSTQLKSERWAVCWAVLSLASLISAFLAGWLA